MRSADAIRQINSRWTRCKYGVLLYRHLRSVRYQRQLGMDLIKGDNIAHGGCCNAAFAHAAAARIDSRP